MFLKLYSLYYICVFPILCVHYVCIQWLEKIRSPGIMDLKIVLSYGSMRTPLWVLRTESKSSGKTKYFKMRGQHLLPLFCYTLWTLFRLVRKGLMCVSTWTDTMHWRPCEMDIKFPCKNCSYVKGKNKEY